MSCKRVEALFIGVFVVAACTQQGPSLARPAPLFFAIDTANVDFLPQRPIQLCDGASRFFQCVQTNHTKATMIATSTDNWKR